MNYGEELAYWYLRFNGFFPLTNLVLHRTLSQSDPSDCDVLAIRHPHISEEVGGQGHDWDTQLFGNLDDTKILGVICEVKTGGYTSAKVLPRESINSGIKRLGFFEETSDILEALSAQRSHTQGNYQFIKLLISDSEDQNTNYFHISLSVVRDFLRARIRTYIDRKYAERMFFNSILIQELIWEVKLEERGRR